MPDRYYLTTAIAYANNKPGLHTLYEVIGADVDRALASDEGRRHALPDRHRRALGQHRPGARSTQGRPPRDFVDEKVGCSRPPRPPSGSRRTGSSGRPTPTTCEAAQEMVRRAYAERRHLPRHVRGLVLPERGLPQRDATSRRRPAARSARTTPTSRSSG